MSGSFEKVSSFRDSDFFKPKDVFGRDLEQFPIVIRDPSDLKRLTDLNPMLQTGEII
jgi:hypothetical protein